MINSSHVQKPNLILQSTFNKENRLAARPEKKATADWPTHLSWGGRRTRHEIVAGREEGRDIAKLMDTFSHCIGLTATTYSRDKISPWASTPWRGTGQEGSLTKGQWKEETREGPCLREDLRARLLWRLPQKNKQWYRSMKKSRGPALHGNLVSILKSITKASI